MPLFFFLHSTMQVPYRMCYVAGKGIGLFSLERVPQHTLVWDFHAANLQIHNDQSARAFVPSSVDLSDLLKYSYFTDDGLLVDIRKDDGRFFNHSNTPNVALGSVLRAQGISGNFHPTSTYALRDIEPGEELLDDYNSYGMSL